MTKRTHRRTDSQLPEPVVEQDPIALAILGPKLAAMDTKRTVGAAEQRIRKHRKKRDDLLAGALRDAAIAAMVKAGE